MPMKLQRLPIPVHIDEFIEYGGKAVCSNHVFNFKIGKFVSQSVSLLFFPRHTLISEKRKLSFTQLIDCLTGAISLQFKNWLLSQVE